MEGASKGEEMKERKREGKLGNREKRREREGKQTRGNDGEVKGRVGRDERR